MNDTVRDNVAHDRISRLEVKVDGHQTWLVQLQECYHKTDKKIDVNALILNQLTDQIKNLEDTVNRNAKEGRERHEMAEQRQAKHEKWNKMNPAIILGGMTAILTVIETGSLKPLITFLAKLAGAN